MLTGHTKSHSPGKQASLWHWRNNAQEHASAPPTQPRKSIARACPARDRTQISMRRGWGLFNFGFVQMAEPWFARIQTLTILSVVDVNNSRVAQRRRKAEEEGDGSIAPHGFGGDADWRFFGGWER